MLITHKHYTTKRQKCLYKNVDKYPEGVYNECEMRNVKCLANAKSVSKIRN